MPIVGNRYYNDPALGAAFGNLASAFAPPSGSDLAGFATAKAKNEEAARLSELFEYSKNPDYDQALADRMGVLGGLYAPNQSYYSVDQSNLTTQRGQDITADTSRYATNVGARTAMRGQDITARTSRENNFLDNQRALVQDRFGALGQGEVRPELPPEIAALLGLPGLSPVEGAPMPLSETQQKAAERQGLIEQGLITDENLAQLVMGEETPVQTVGEDGKPQFMHPGEAVRGGAPAYVNKGASAKPSNGIAVLPDGSKVTAVQDTDTGRWRDAQTGTELPAGVQIFNLPTPTGSSSEVGLTAGTQSKVQQQLLSINQTLDTARALRNLVETSPSSQGLVGSIRGTAQDVVQTGNELGQFFGENIQQVNEAVQNGLLEAGVAAENFDPNIPAIQMLQNLLAWQYAKSLSGDRVSNEQLAQARKALGGEGMFANRANTITRLDQLIGQMERQGQQLQGYAPGVEFQGGAPASTGAGGGAERWERGPDGQLRRVN